MADLLLGIKIGAQGGPQTVKEIKAIDDRVKALQEQNRRAAETAKQLGEAYQLSDAEIDSLVRELIRLDQQTEAATESARKAEEAYNNLSATEKAIRLLQDALSPDQNAARLLNVLGQIRAGSQDTAVVAARLKTAFNLDDEKAQRLAVAIDRLQDESEDATVVARQLGQELDLSDVEVDALVREMNRLKGAVDDTSDRATFMQEVFTGFVRSIGERGLDLVINSIRGLGQALTDTAQQSIGLANQYTAAQAALATLGADSDSIAQALAGVSTELGGQVDTVELLQGSYDIVSSGFTDAADVAKIAEASVKGATAGFSDFATVSDALTSVINAYGLSADDAARVTDNFLAVQNAGKITVAQYGAQIGVVASIAAQAGVSIDELGAFVATATAKGVRYESAITGLRQAISSILKPSKEAQDLAAELGVGFDATSLQTKGLSGVLADLNATGNDSQETLIKLFGSVEAVAAIAPATGSGIDDLNRNLAFITNSAGEADKGFQLIAGTVEGAGAALRGTLNNALLELGRALQPLQGTLLNFASALATATINGLGGFEGLAEASQRFQEALTGNPALVQELGRALAEILQLITLGLTDAINSFANQIEQLDPRAIQAFSQGFIDVSQTIFSLIQTLGTIATTVVQITSVVVGQVSGPISGAFSALLDVIDPVLAFVNLLVGLMANLAQNTGLVNTVFQTLAIRLIAIQALSFGKTITTITAAISAQIAAVGGLSAGLVALKAAALTAAAGLGTTIAAAAAAAGPFVVLAAAVASVNFIKFTRDLKVANDALDAYTVGVDVSTATAFDFANKLNNINDAIAQANGKATDEQKRQLTELARLSKEQIDDLNRQLEEVESFEPKNQDQAAAQQALAAQIRTTITALENQVKEAETNLSAAAQQTGQASGQALGEGVSEAATGAVEAAATEVEGALTKLTTANRTALTQIERDANLAKAAILERGGTEEEITANETASIQKRIDANKEYLKQLQGLTNQSAEDQAKTAEEILRVETTLANDRVTLAQRVATTRMEEAQKAAKEEADALKAVQEEQKRLAQEAFADRQRDEGTIFSDAQAEKAEAFQNAQNARQKTFQETLQGEQERFSENQNNRQKAFQKQQQSDATAFQDRQNAASKAFQESQQAAAKAFQESQQAAANAFQAKQQAAADRANREFGVLTNEVERRFQIQQAANAQERAELEDKFRLEDEQLKERRKIESQVLREQGSILSRRNEAVQLSPLEQAQKDFADQQRAEADAFQKAQQLQAAEFQLAQQAESEAFQLNQRLEAQAFQEEQQLATEEFELAQRAAQKAFQDQQEAQTEAFQQAQQERQKAFQLEQREIERAFQEQQRAEQAAFAAQQRELDKQNAREVQAILDRASGTSAQSLRSGGVAEGGIVQVHKDEFLIPPKGTRVVSQADSRALVRESLASTPEIPVSRVAMSTKGIEARLDALLATVQSRGPLVAPSSFTLNTQSPVQDAVAIQLQQIRGLTRRGIL